MREDAYVHELFISNCHLVPNMDRALVCRGLILWRRLLPTITEENLNGRKSVDVYNRTL